MILRKIATVAAISILALAPVQVAVAETLAETLASAYQNSGLLEQNRAVLRAADEDVAQAVSALRPAITYALQGGYSSLNGTDGDHLSSSATLTAQLRIFQFGRGRLAVDATKEAVLATREALISVEQGVLLRAVQAYMNVRRDAEFVALNNSNVRLITQELRAARDRFEVGEITRTDVSIAEARLAAARAGLAASEGALLISREEYRAAVGQYPGTLAPPSGTPETVASVESAQAIAAGRHPDLLRAQREATIAELNIAITERGMLPGVDVSATAGRTDRGVDTSNVGVTISGPVWQGGQLKSMQRQAIAQRDAARAGVRLAAIAVQQNVGNAWANLAVSFAQIEATDRQIRAATAAWRGVREEARLGSRTTLDVLDAEQELLDARANRISAESDAQVAAYNLLASMGLLTVRHLNLGIQTYDPADYYDAVSDAPSRPATSEQGERLDALLRSLAGQ